MESTGKVVAAAVAIALVLGGIFFALQWNLREGLFLGPAAQPAAVAIAVQGAAPVGGGAVTTLTGSLTYYDQQGRSVPYLIYTDARGGMHSKALAFRDESICVTSIEAPCPGDLHTLIDDYGAGPVTIQGIIDDESIIVERIASAS